MRVGIVGGSIAGCSAAHLFLKEGHEVTVFERSGKTLVGRGGGIGTTPEMLKQLRDDGLIKNDFADFKINEMPFIGKTDSHEPYGRTAWAIPINFNVFQWNELWKCLRNKIPNDCYRRGIQIIGAKMKDPATVELKTVDNETACFDLVIFADGYNSLGRKILFPDKKLKYRGYVLWRGLLPESEMEGPCKIGHQILRLSYVDKPGHNVVYFIPNETGSTLEGERVFNWAAYIAVSEDELKNLMTDVDGIDRIGTLPPGKLSVKNESDLKKFISANTPGYYSDLVNKTTNSYIQVIYTLDLEDYYKDRMCLIGDAGMVVQPFTGSGVFKGYNNAKDLVEALKTDPVAIALQKWNVKQLQSGKRFLALGEQMEKAFIWEQPDFSKINSEQTSKWWNESISFPDNFKFERT